MEKVKLKYNEDKIIKEVFDYIQSTYNNIMLGRKKYKH